MREQQGVAESSDKRRLRAGSNIISVVSLVFVAFSIFGILNPMDGEEVLTGVTYQELESSTPGVAQTIQHYNTGIWLMVDGLAILMAVLAWKGLRQGSRLALYVIAWSAVVFLISLLGGHVFVSHPGLAHWGPPAALTLVLLAGVALAARPVMSSEDRAALP